MQDARLYPILEPIVPNKARDMPQIKSTEDEVEYILNSLFVENIPATSIVSVRQISCINYDVLMVMVNIVEVCVFCFGQNSTYSTS